MSRVARTWLGLGAVLSIGAAVASACSATGNTGAEAAGSEGGTSHASGSTSNGGAGGNGGDPTFATGSTTGTGGLDKDAACVSVSSTAMSQIQPADIIIAVDTSGSMDAESAQVQQNLNTLAAIIAGSGIDVHVVLLADDSVCIPAPLGSGSCSGADEKLPAYRHVVTGVASNDGLQKMLDTYPMWKGSLRADATKTLAIVSDDDSDLSAAAFTSALLALDPPTFQGFKFDAIVSFDAPDVCFLCLINCVACTSKCCDKALICAPISAAEGKVYKQLVQQTGGVIGDLCAQNFVPVFQDMATAIVKGSKLSCDYPIPAVPGGGTIDPAAVNVAYTAGGSNMPQTIFNVPGGAADCGMKGGWYYDDPQKPTTIIICPNTCAVLQGDPGGKVDVLFGCETIVKPPE